MNTTLVSVEWLNDQLSNKGLIILDASTTTNKAGLSPTSKNRIIPNARHFALKENFTNKASKFPNTFPSPQQFEKESRKLGINKSSHIVIYDNLGIYSSPRVWWMFKTMGHEKVSVLDGGLPAWIAKGFPTEVKAERMHKSGDFEANLEGRSVKSYEDILENLDSTKSLIVDARSEGRFNGTAEEPRKHLKSGHIPNSKNIFYKRLLNGGKFKPKTELTEIFKEISTDNRELVFSCGSGMTACITLLAAELVLENKTAVYDGSWAEWAELQNLRVDGGG